MCVLRVSSKKHSFDDFLKKTNIDYYESHNKNDFKKNMKNKDEKYNDHGFKVNISNKKMNNLKGQISDAINYLKKNNEKLIMLKTFDDIDLKLDFPNKLRISEDIIAQFDFFPPELIKLSGEIGLGIELSTYLCND